jgi:hypothetical protein
MAVLSVVLAWLTYQLIERPIRRSRRRGVILGLCLAMLLVVAAGVVVKKNDGFKMRLAGLMNGDVTTTILNKNPSHFRNECGVAPPYKEDLPKCLTNGTGTPRYVVVGDSKAEALYYGLADELANDSPGTLINTFTPMNLEPTSTQLKEDKRIAANVAWQSVLDSSSIKLVIWVVALRNGFSLDKDDNIIGGIPVDELFAAWGKVIQQAEASGKRVMFVMDNPTLSDPGNCISGGLTSSALLNQFLSRHKDPRCEIRYTEHLAKTLPYRKFAAELKQRHPTLIVYDPTPLLCDIQNNMCNITLNGNFLYSYSDHISHFASAMLGRDMRGEIKNLIASPAAK